MTKNPFSLPFSSRLVAASALVAVPFALWSLSALAAPTQNRPAASKAKTRLAALPASSRRAVKPAPSGVPLPPYVSMATIKRLQKQANARPLPVLQPFWDGKSIQKPMRDLLSGPIYDVNLQVRPRKTANQKAGSMNGKRLAQAFPRPVAPASPRQFRRRGAPTVVPRWVRYPLEFQLAGISLGTRAVDKDRFNRIDRYGLFALHGNPTAVVRAIVPAAGAGGGGEGGAPPGAGGAPGGGALGGRGGAAGAIGGEGGPGAAAAPTTGTNLTLQQTPPETASLFPQSERGGGLPGWALAITVQLDNNHVEWLYNRGTYSMGFVVDRLGFVDAIIVAGLQSDIATTQLEDPLHSVVLGSDLRKVLFRYGYPDDIVPLAADPAATANNTTGAPGGGGGGAIGGEGGALGGRGGAIGGAEGGGGAAGADAAGANGAFRTYDLRYEQSYNVVFTIRNNRVVRMYIFGDPDFFNATRRNQLRTRY
ncbi:MAG TPA: hypothetical protein VF627_05670 [Abditibacterium sp.]|jgi:hypothetical protein